MALKSDEFKKLWPGMEAANLDVLVLQLITLVNDLKAKYNASVALINELKTDLSAHTHGGVTAGGDTSSAGPTISATDAAVTAATTVVNTF